MYDHPMKEDGKAADAPGKPDEAARDALEQLSGVDCRMCWTCGTCDLECPLNIAAGRLHPQRINRLAYLGWVDELLSLHEIWYCLQCRRCSHACPNRVKPADVIAFVREEACRKGIVNIEEVTRYREYYAMFQRARWHAAEACLAGELEKVSPDCWDQWLSTPVEPPYDQAVLTGRKKYDRKRRDEFPDCSPSPCYTCSECSGACPIFCERGLFDPQAIVRMATLGMIDELLQSPAIWLCLGCRRCGDLCAQRVKAHQVVERLRQMALSEGIVDREFPLRLERAEKLIYPLYVGGVDRIFGFSQGERRAPGTCV